MPLNCITSFDEENCMKIYEDMIESKWKTHQSIELVETNLVMWVWKRNKEVFTTKKTFSFMKLHFLLDMMKLGNENSWSDVIRKRAEWRKFGGWSSCHGHCSVKSCTFPMKITWSIEKCLLYSAIKKSIQTDA